MNLSDVRCLLAYRHPHADRKDACHEGLGVTANNIVLSLAERRISSSVRAVLNGEYLWAKLAGEWADTTHLVLCAPYIDAPFLRKLAKNFEQKQFCVCYHSNVGFLTVDEFATRELPEYLEVQAELPNFRLSANSLELVRAIEAGMGDPSLYLPNLYHLNGPVKRDRTAWHRGHTLHVGLFGATRVLKNPLTAAWAALIMQRALDADVELHISTGRDEGGGPSLRNIRYIVATNPRVKLVEEPWSSWDDFCRLVQRMDLLLQPSFTESFNGVTADGCSRGVPSVVSDAIDWVPQDWIAKADSATEIAEVGLRLVRQGPKAGERGWAALKRYNQNAIDHWVNWLAA